MAIKKPRHYVNNKDFFLALVEYQKVCKETIKKGKSLPQIPNYIGVCIQLICKRLSLKLNFIRYTYSEEMVGDGIENCCAAVDNFKPEVSQNPFAYFTSIAYNAFIRRIERESTQNYTKHKNLENLFVLSDEFYSELESATTQVNNVISGDKEGLQRHYDVIRAFEEKQARKKEKARQNALNKKKSTPSKKPDRKTKAKKK